MSTKDDILFCYTFEFVSSRSVSDLLFRIYMSLEEGCRDLISGRHFNAARNRQCMQPRGVVTWTQYWNDAGAILREHLSVARYSIRMWSASESYCILVYL